jgi:Protein of unknown function (DUF3054)
MPRAVPPAVDALLVLAFVVLGRRSHEEGTALVGTLTVAAPFLVALAAGWLAGFRFWRQPLSWRFGVLLWAVTLVLGMLLRHVVWDRGTAASFVVVAGLFLALFLIGWRVAASAVVRHRRTPHAPHPSV